MIDTIKIKAPKKEFKARINLTASKSESNRVLLIQALCKQNFTVSNSNGKCQKLNSLTVIRGFAGWQKIGSLINF